MLSFFLKEMEWKSLRKGVQKAWGWRGKVKKKDKNSHGQNYHQACVVQNVIDNSRLVLAFTAITELTISQWCEMDTYLLYRRGANDDDDDDDDDGYRTLSSALYISSRAPGGFSEFPHQGPRYQAEDPVCFKGGRHTIKVWRSIGPGYVSPRSGH